MESLTKKLKSGEAKYPELSQAWLTVFMYREAASTKISVDEMKIFAGERHGSIPDEREKTFLTK